MKRRSKIEEGVSSYYEAIWHRRRRLLILGQRRWTYRKQGESEYRWAHPRNRSPDRLISARFKKRG